MGLDASNFGVAVVRVDEHLVAIRVVTGHRRVEKRLEEFLGTGLEDDHLGSHPLAIDGTHVGG